MPLQCQAASVWRHFGPIDVMFRAGRSWLDGRDARIEHGIEESPGSLDRLPGNAWARLCRTRVVVTASATENKPPGEEFVDPPGKGEKVE